MMTLYMVKQVKRKQESIYVLKDGERFWYRPCTIEMPLKDIKKWFKYATETNMVDGMGDFWSSEKTGDLLQDHLGELTTVLVWRPEAGKPFFDYPDADERLF